MPFFRIEINLALKRYIQFREVDGVDLETYYTTIYKQAKQSFGIELVYCDVVQISEQSRTAVHMKIHGLKKMISKYPK